MKGWTEKCGESEGNIIRNSGQASATTGKFASQHFSLGRLYKDLIDMEKLH